MKGLRRKFERFCYSNRNKGIPNLMLYITIGMTIVYLLTGLDRSQTLYMALCFDRNLILHGQIWRLFTFIFVYNAKNPLVFAIAMLCYYSLGKAMENIWGTCKFNLYYLTGLVLMDIYGLIFNLPFFVMDCSYLNMSLLLAYATSYPDTCFLLFFIIPIKAWLLALLDLGLTVFYVTQWIRIGIPFPANLFPVVAIANYLLFFGKDVVNVIPMSWRVNASRNFKKKPKKQTGSIPFSNAGSYQAATTKPEAPYTHKCTVCGRTDVTNPELEFRYCSKCNGYYCYCEDHINNHTHIQ